MIKQEHQPPCGIRGKCLPGSDNSLPEAAESTSHHPPPRRQTGLPEASTRPRAVRRIAAVGNRSSISATLPSATASRLRHHRYSVQRSLRPLQARYSCQYAATSLSTKSALRANSPSLRPCTARDFTLTGLRYPPNRLILTSTGVRRTDLLPSCRHQRTENTSKAPAGWVTLKPSASLSRARSVRSNAAWSSGVTSPFSKLSRKAARFAAGSVAASLSGMKVSLFHRGREAISTPRCGLRNGTLR